MNRNHSVTTVYQLYNILKENALKNRTTKPYTSICSYEQ